jgi:hypothetical protein
VGNLKIQKFGANHNIGHECRRKLSMGPQVKGKLAEKRKFLGRDGKFDSISFL